MKIVSNRKPNKKFIGWVYKGKLLSNFEGRDDILSITLNPDGKTAVWSSINSLHEGSFYIDEETYPIYEGDEITLKF